MIDKVSKSYIKKQICRNILEKNYFLQRSFDKLFEVVQV